jgi:hypothetical protein
MGTSDLKTRWQRFVDTPFPRPLELDEIEGVCLTSTDTFMAGSIDTFVTRRRLDVKRKEVLTGCCADLERVLAKIQPDDARSYFAELLALGEEVLSSARAS